MLGKTPAREDIGAFKDIPANDPVDLSKVKELHRDLDFQTTESIRLGMVPQGTEFDASIFRAIPELDDYYSDLPDIFRFDNPNSSRTARDERINFIDSREKIDKIRQYGFPIERDPDFKGDPGPDNVFYRAFLRKKNIKNIDIIKAMMAGGSVIGCPKIRTLELLNSQEKEDRNIFTGSFGYIKFNQDMRINIINR